MIPLLILTGDSIYAFFAFRIIGIALYNSIWIVVFIGFFILIILRLSSWRFKAKPTLEKITHIYYLIYISIIGLILLVKAIFCTCIIVILLGCFITTSIIGSVKITNSYSNKDLETKTKNIIGNIILIILSVIIIFLVSMTFGFLFTITPGLIIINSIIDLIHLNANSSQQNRPFLSTKDITRKDLIENFVKSAKKVWSKISESINSILFFLAITSFGIITTLTLKITFNEAAFDEKPSGWITLLFIQFLLLGLITFLEIYIHVPLNRIKKLQNPENNTLLVLNTLQIICKEQRISGRKTILASIISSLFLLIGTISILFSFTLREYNIWSKLGFEGRHFINFLNVLKFPFTAIIFLFIVIILILGFFTAGWVSKNQKQSH